MSRWSISSMASSPLADHAKRGRDAQCTVTAAERNVCSYISFLLNWLARYSACRIASATMVNVGFSAPPVVNWLPSEMNRLATSWAWPYLLHTPSCAFSLWRQVPTLWGVVHGGGLNTR